MLSAASNETIHLPRLETEPRASLERAERKSALLEQLVAIMLCDLTAQWTCWKQTSLPCNCSDRRGYLKKKCCVLLSEYQTIKTVNSQDVKISLGIPCTAKKKAAACSQLEEFVFQKEVPHAVGRSEDRRDGLKLRQRRAGLRFNQDCPAL